jgi:hypothetical protein
MRYEAGSSSLHFRSADEVRDFHLQVSALIRGAMVQATRTVEDPARAKELSRELLKEYGVVIRALNALRSVLPHKEF